MNELGRSRPRDRTVHSPHHRRALGGELGTGSMHSPDRGALPDLSADRSPLRKSANIAARVEELKDNNKDEEDSEAEPINASTSGK